MVKLYQHQKTALEKTKDRNRVAYYLDMGLGKTFVGSEKIKALHAKTNLLICQKSKIQDWIEHFNTYYPEYTIINLRGKGAVDAFVDSQGKQEAIGIINYDLVYIRPTLLNLKDFTLILDESSIIQNETTKRAKFVLKLNPLNVILLSGTPTAGKYEKLWSQLHLLGWTISKDLYWKQYVDEQWYEDKESGFRRSFVAGYKNVDRLKYKLAAHGAIFMKSEEALDLPEQNIVKIRSPVTKEYRSFMRNSIVEYNGKEYIGDTVLAKRLYARMLCSYLNPDKVAAFRDLVESTEDRLIVFYNFNEELNVLKDSILELERPLSFVNGKDKDLTAYEEHEDSITFVQYQAGAMGLNLQKANKVIYFSLTDKSELFEQSKKRIHRIGQEKPCFYYYMICPGSIEEAILETLQMRKDYTDELFKEYQKNFYG